MRSTNLDRNLETPRERDYGRFFRDSSFDTRWDVDDIIPRKYFQSDAIYGIFDYTQRQFVRVIGVADLFEGSADGPYLDVPVSDESPEWGENFNGNVVAVLITLHQVGIFFGMDRSGPWAGGRLATTPFMEFEPGSEWMDVTTDACELFLECINPE